MKNTTNQTIRKVSIKKTYSAKPADVVRVWYQLDASDISLGRLATKAASLLIGKGKPIFTNHIDCGDFVIITNADNLKVTGNKATDKMYHRHSSHPSGLHSRSLQEMPSVEVVKQAVSGMLPDNKLKANRLIRLRIYAGNDHPHNPQKPITLTLKEKM